MMQLATCVNNQPWVCNVWFAADDDMNIYWFSAVNRRHSKELEKNPKVSASIVLPHSPKDPPRGIQLEGIGEVLTNPSDVAKARSVYEDRIFDASTIDSFINHKQRPHKFYRIKPTMYVLFDVRNFPENARQEYQV